MTRHRGPQAVWHVLLIAGLLVPRVAAGTTEPSTAGVAGASPNAADKDGPTPSVDVVARIGATADGIAQLRQELPTLVPPSDIRANLRTLTAVFDQTARWVQEQTRRGDATYLALGSQRRVVQQAVAQVQALHEDLSAKLAQIGQLASFWEAQRSTPNTPEATTPKAVEEAVAGALRDVELAQQRLQRPTDQASDLLTRGKLLLADLDAVMERARRREFQGGHPSLFSAEFWRLMRRDWSVPQAAQSVALVLREHVGLVRLHWYRLVLVLGLTILFSFALRAVATQSGSRAAVLRLVPRKWAASFLLAIVATIPFYPADTSQLWLLGLWSGALVAGYRIMQPLAVPARRRLLYVLASVVFVSNRLLLFLNVPEEPARLVRFTLGLVTALWAAVAFRRVRRREASWRAGMWLAAAAVLGAATAATEVAGYAGVASFLLDASLRTLFVVAIGWLLSEALSQWSDALFRGAARFKLGPLARHSQRIASILGRALVAMVSLGVMFVLCEVWRLAATPMEAASALFAVQIPYWPGRSLELAIILAGIAIVYIASGLSWLLQDVLLTDLVSRKSIERGTALSVGKLFHYALITLGVLMAVSVMGFDLASLALMFGALGIGVGLGLQDFVNDFVSGLVLLFERPVKVGDFVEFGGRTGHVQQLGLRATVIRAIDQSEIIVPNRSLVSQEVTNLTLTDAAVRVNIPVGVSYGSDVSKVIEVLSQCAREEPTVQQEPPPEVLFLAFGDSSLNFELRVWVAHAEQRLVVRSALHCRIANAFRASGIEIPFPQRDLHLRSASTAVVSALKSSQV